MQSATLEQTNSQAPEMLVSLDLEFNWKDDPVTDPEVWGLSLPFSLQ